MHCMTGAWDSATTGVKAQGVNPTAGFTGGTAGSCTVTTRPAGQEVPLHGCTSLKPRDRGPGKSGPFRDSTLARDQAHWPGRTSGMATELWRLSAVECIELLRAGQVGGAAAEGSNRGGRRGCRRFADGAHARPRQRAPAARPHRQETCPRLRPACGVLTRRWRPCSWWRPATSAGRWGRNRSIRAVPLQGLGL